MAFVRCLGHEGVVFGNEVVNLERRPHPHLHPQVGIVAQMQTACSVAWCSGLNTQYQNRRQGGSYRRRKRGREEGGEEEEKDRPPGNCFVELQPQQGATYGKVAFTKQAFCQHVDLTFPELQEVNLFLSNCQCCFSSQTQLTETITLLWQRQSEQSWFYTSSWELQDLKMQC